MVLSIAAFVVIVLIALLSVIPFRSETARIKLVAVLADRLDSEVQLDSLQLRVLPRLRAEGTGLTIRHKGRTDVPPLISIRSFSVEGGVMPLLRKHVSLVTLQGLEIKIPPRDHDGDQPESDDKTKNDLDRTFVIDNLVTSNATLTIIPRKENKRPKVWAIHDLNMQAVSFDQAMPYEATVTNAIPPGEIVTHGSFGPWSSEDPGQTPLDGTFVFEKADLSVFKGIAGILSAQGTFGGRLEQIEVHGETTTP